MRQLFVLYDEDCGLCRQLAAWLWTQPKLIPLNPIPAQSPSAAQLFPGMASAAAPQELAVVGDDGAVWLGNHAWIMCLYALRYYRPWAKKLAHPLLEPLARQAFLTLSRHRSMISRFMGEHELADRLRNVSAPACRVGSGIPHA
jgi:predicted DCC family thiol-disulfide oxidoreductase YuxK